MKQDLYLEMITKNIEVATLYFKSDDFQLMNILGNRIMSDSLFYKTGDFTVVGFFVKQMALSYINLKPLLSDSDFLDAKLVGEKYLDSLLSISETKDKAKWWAAFHEFNIQIKNYSGSDIDKQVKKIYGENTQITESVRRWLTDLLSSKRELLFHANNNLLKGIINDFQRVGLSYGYQVADTIVFSFLVALDRYYDYFAFQYTGPDGGIDKEEVKKTVFPYVDKVKELASSDKIEYDNITSLIGELIKGWREFYIYYSELPHRATEKVIELPEESKKRLSEVLGKALQREIKH